MAKKKKQTSNQLEVQNAAKTLFANIRFMSPDNPVRSLVLTSSVPNEGKSTCAVELARAIATSGKTVILVEADMRRRTLASLLNVRPAAGVYSVLTDATPLSAAVVSTSTPNLSFLDVEPNIPNPADILSSKRYRKLVTLLEENYDYVLFDTPPVGTFIDAAILSTLVDGTVMVVKPNSTKRAELVDAYEQLKKADAHVLGICATFCEGTGSEYYYAYYTNSGERVKPDKGREVSQQSVAVSRGSRAQTPTPHVGQADVRRTAATQASNRAGYVAAATKTKGRGAR
ncbi:CpsD/CapB family tyrosine-protein kinase [Eggerthella sp. YY7918]|uniref:CpsD/CapB family tyrosine-protein kinase n=1 Tax=Eggerthella sp. (strain YY7918) TaxID=502558 RepID=UPI0002170FC8|nr:CpsD/CapB family tyrosine-protein kinase [Eggerthella sp. YY7918]BAK43904.1 ATPase involved in chromosome partitioning [Eggerthella sp. YY7918]